MCNILYILDILGVLNKGRKALCVCVVDSDELEVTFRVKGQGRVRCTYYQGGSKKYKFVQMPADIITNPPAVLTITADANSSISLEGRVENLDISTNGADPAIREVYLKHNSGIKTLYAYSNMIHKIAVEKCPKLQDLEIYDNWITELTIDDWKAVTILDLSNNPLPDLDLSQAHAGIYVYLNQTQIAQSEASQLAFVNTLPDIAAGTIEFQAPAYASVNLAASAKGWNINYV